MKRKAIQLAKQTIVVSLPAKWVRQQGIKKGDEIDVEERGKELVIGSRGEKEEKKIEIDISGLNDAVIRRFLSSLHKIGYNEIEIIYKEPAIKTIEEMLKDLFTGFAIIDQSENKCIIRAVSKDSETEFDMALRRAFLVTLSMGESCLEMIKHGKLKSLNELIALEHTNNQLTNLCERILNKYGYKDYNKTCFMYIIVWTSEKICDEYKYICEYLPKKENNKIKISQNLINLFEKVNNLIKSYYELLYKFEIIKLNNLIEEKDKFEIEAKKLFKITADKEIIVIHHLLEIIKRSMDFSVSMISLNY